MKARLRRNSFYEHTGRFSPHGQAYPSRMNLPNPTNCYNFYAADSTMHQDRKAPHNTSNYYPKNYGNLNEIPVGMHFKNKLLNKALTFNDTPNSRRSLNNNHLGRQPRLNNDYQNHRAASVKYQRTYSANSGQYHVVHEENALPSHQLKIIDNLSTNKLMGANEIPQYRRDMLSHAQIFRNHCYEGVVSLTDVSTALPSGASSDKRNKIDEFTTEEGSSATISNTASAPRFNSLSQNTNNNAMNQQVNYFNRVNGNFYRNDIGFSSNSLTTNSANMSINIENLKLNNNTNNLTNNGQQQQQDSTLNSAVISLIDGCEVFLDKNHQNQYRNQKQRTSTIENLTRSNPTEEAFKKPLNLFRVNDYHSKTLETHSDQILTKMNKHTMLQSKNNISDTEKVVGILLSSLKTQKKYLPIENISQLNPKSKLVNKKNLNNSIIGGSCDRISAKFANNDKEMLAEKACFYITKDVDSSGRDDTNEMMYRQANLKDLNSSENSVFTYKMVPISVSQNDVIGTSKVKMNNLRLDGSSCGTLVQKRNSLLAKHHANNVNDSQAKFINNLAGSRYANDDGSTSNATVASNGSSSSNFIASSTIQSNPFGSIVANLGSASVRTSRSLFQKDKNRARAHSMNNYPDFATFESVGVTKTVTMASIPSQQKTIERHKSECEMPVSQTSLIESNSSSNSATNIFTKLTTHAQLLTVTNVKAHFV